ncbi:MAG: T9SS type A sorting domain-containing protein [Bacteroidetes bacterium]|nr:T9SS type A sorting domain-containing protein [Bacteroidota bacterium]
MKLFYCIALAFCSFIAKAQAPVFDWVTHEGSGTEEVGWKARRLPNGEFYASFGFKGSIVIGGTTYVQGGPMNYDFVICKYDASGNVIWVKQMWANVDNVRFPSMEIDGEGNLYLTTNFQGTLTFSGGSYTPIAAQFSNPLGIFATKISPSGNVQWAKVLVSSFGVGGNCMLAVKTNGNFIICDYMVDSVRIDNSTHHGPHNDQVKNFFAEFDRYGAKQWFTDEPNYKNISAIKLDVNETYLYVAGNYSGSVGFTGASGTSLNSVGQTDIYLAKYQAFGFAYCMWSLNIGSPTDDNVSSLIVDNSDNVHVLAKISSSTSLNSIPLTVGNQPTYFDIISNPSGAIISGSRVCDGSSMFISESSKDNAGNIYYSGEYSGTLAFPSVTVSSNGGNDALIIKLAASTSSHKWTKSFGGLENDRIRAVASNDNELIGVGNFRGIIDLGEWEFTSHGSIDPFLAKLSGCDLPSTNLTSDDTVLCSGQTLLMRATNLAGATYQWFNGGTAISNQTNDSITINVPGAYTVLIDLGGTCKDTLGPVHIVEKDIESPQIITGANCMLASSVTASGYTYHWELNGNPIAGDSPYLNAATYGSGFYSLHISDGEGCMADSDSDVSVDATDCTATGIGSLHMPVNLSAYPNPTCDRIQIDVQPIPAGQYHVSIVDFLGRIVFADIVNVTPNIQSVTFAFDDLPSGVYHIAIKNGGHLFSTKVLRT